jgi:hypothetical protein
VSTADICREIERHLSCIDGTTYTFEVQSIALRHGPSGQAVLQVGAFRRSALGPPALTSCLRVTAAIRDLHQVPSLLTNALQLWLFASAPAGPVVH